MEKSFVFYGLALIFLLALGAFILFESKNQIEKTSDSAKLSPRAIADNVPESDIVDINEDSVSESDQENPSSEDSDSSEGGSSQSSETSDEILVENNVDSKSYCGVSNQFDITDKKLETSLNEAQKVILECMADSLSSCSDGKMQLISNTGGSDWVYSINDDGSAGCVVQGRYSASNLKNCSFSNEAISSLFSQAQIEYPNLPAAKFFKIMEIVYSGEGEVNLTSGGKQTITCL